MVCVICNSKSFHLFLFKLCIMIVYKLKMCTSYFVFILSIFSYFLLGVQLRHFSSKMLRGCLICVICNSTSFHSFILKQHIDFTRIEDVHLLFCAHLINIFLFLVGVDNNM